MSPDMQEATIDMMLRNKASVSIKDALHVIEGIDKVIKNQKTKEYKNNVQSTSK